MTDTKDMDKVNMGIRGGRANRYDNRVYNSGDDDVASTYQQRATVKKQPISIILGLVCGLAVFLLIVCCCLIALVVRLDEKLRANVHQLYDSNRPLEYVKMTSRSFSPDPTFRLSKDIRPSHYDLYLHPDLERGTFEGKVTIRIDVTNPTSYIALHQKDLGITRASLRSYDRDDEYDIPIKEYRTVDKREELLVTFHEDLYLGLYNLTFEFNGTLQPDKIVGFYSSKYKDMDNRTRYIATSKFEPTYARRAFPCFDEPSFKARFTIRLVHPTGDDYGALSSMNVKTAHIDQPGPGLTTVNFAESVPMSTYLICFIVSDFAAVTAPAKTLEGNVFPISVYTARAQKEKAQFALEIGVLIIEYYSRLFGIDYPLPKLDMAAIPDFVSGAMENWGLVTYREARLFYDRETSSTSDKEGVVLVISHELAHMWFGNLVTMAWWNDLWLNEGFATFMQYRSADAILADWGLMDKFLPDTLHPVLVTDSKLSSHPIVQTVNSPDEITALFDVITYNKGASVLRMLDNFVGSKIFNSGVSAYLDRFAFRNAETADLFGILQSAVIDRINVTSIMDTWTRQMGYPVINVSKNGTSSYVLTQKRFLADPDAAFDPTESNYGYKWTVPVTYITDKKSIPTLVWFEKEASKLEVKFDEPIEWIKFNHNQVGYYRVNYEAQDWKKLSELLVSHHKRFTIGDRTHLLEEAFSLAEASQLDYSVPMNMTGYLGSERSSVPWTIAASKLMAIDELLSTSAYTSKYREYVRGLVDRVYRAVTWKVDRFEDHDMLSLRRSVLKLACAVGHRECLEEAGKIFKAWINDTNDARPPPDIRSLVYYYGMNYAGGEAEWDVMLRRFVRETNAVEKMKLMNGLAGVRSSWLLKKYIAMSIDGDYIRGQDTFSCLISISRNPVGTPLVWDWIRDNWQLLVDRYTLNDRYLGRLIPSITASFATELRLDEMRAFFERYPDAGSGKTARAAALETVGNNVKWLRRNSDKLSDWLNTVAAAMTK